jgi:mevalonate kinase
MDMYSSGLGGLVYMNNSSIPPHSIERYLLDTSLSIVIADTLTPRSTADVIRSKRKRYEDQDPDLFHYVEHTKGAIQDIRKVLNTKAFDLIKLGRLITTCHGYLRDDMKVSTELLDRCVQVSCDRGAIGAKLTGTGMGGCMFALVPSRYADTVVEALSALPVHAYRTNPSNEGLIVENN